MTQTPAGWYPDPDEQAAPGSTRYWNGQAWTAHVQAPAAPAYEAVPQAPAYGQGPEAYQPSGHQVQHPYQPSGQPTYAVPGLPTTPDGQRLAGWWLRVVAYLLDLLILVPVNIAVGWPFWSRILTEYGDFFEATMKAAENGTPAPSQMDLMNQVMAPMLGVSLLSLAVLFVYQNGMLKWKQATLGKMALGLQVRRREQPGPMSWGTVVKRWFGQNIASFVAVVPLVSLLAAIYPVLDSLWPLWDDRKQALHDKVAGTNVVHKR